MLKLPGPKKKDQVKYNKIKLENIWFAWKWAFCLRLVLYFKRMFVHIVSFFSSWSPFHSLSLWRIYAALPNMNYYISVCVDLVLCVYQFSTLFSLSCLYGSDRCAWCELFTVNTQPRSHAALQTQIQAHQFGRPNRVAYHVCTHTLTYTYMVGSNRLLAAFVRHAPYRIMHSYLNSSNTAYLCKASASTWCFACVCVCAVVWTLNECVLL